MGLFDKKDKKKKADDFDSPVEKVDLSAPPPPQAAAPAKPAASAASAAPAQPAAPVAPAAQPAAPARAEKRRQPEPDFGSDYGIDKAIQLMRTLPSDNVELVVQVVKHTLESTNVHIPEIITDAKRKQDDIQGRIKVLRDEIADFEREIETRREEISRLDADYKETSLVRERLELAENLNKKQKADAKPDAAATSASGSLGARKPAAGASGAASKSGSGSTSTSGSIGGSASGSASGKPAARTSKTTIVAKK